MTKTYTLTPEQLKTYTEMCKGNTDNYVDIEKLTPHIIVTTINGEDCYLQVSEDWYQKDIWLENKHSATQFPTLQDALDYQSNSDLLVRFEPVYPKGF